MIDAKKVQQKLIFHCLTSPLTLLPLAVGATVLLGQWAIASFSPFGLLLGIASIFGGGGMFLTNMLLRKEEIYKKVIDDLKADEESQLEGGLDWLYDRLDQDNDPRTEECLSDLRALMDSFREISFRDEGMTNAVTINVISTVDQLFKECISSLEKTLTLYASADRLSSKKARKPLLEERERLITSVQNSINMLSKVLVELSRTDVQRDVSEVQDELKAQLASALEVDRNVKAFMRGKSIDDFE